MKEALLTQLQQLIAAGKEQAMQRINHVMTLTYFLVGRYIVEYEQKGAERASYGKETLQYQP